MVEAACVVKERLMAEAASHAELERLERLERLRREWIKDEQVLAEHHEAEDIPNSIK